MFRVRYFALLFFSMCFFFNSSSAPRKVTASSKNRSSLNASARRTTSKPQVHPPVRIAKPQQSRRGQPLSSTKTAPTSSKRAVTTSKESTVLSGQQVSPLLKTALFVAAKKRAQQNQQSKTSTKNSSSLRTQNQKRTSTQRRVSRPAQQRRRVKPQVKRITRTAVQTLNPAASGQEELAKGPQEALFIWPLKLTEFWISSFFGPRKNPDGKWGFHYGLDLAACKGTMVYAAGEGIVTESTYMPGYGNVIVITHNEEYKTRYAHLDKRLVRKGQQVLCGDPIGKVGATGTVRKTTKNGSGSHLHFEVCKQDKRVNPLYFLA